MEPKSQDSEEETNPRKLGQEEYSDLLYRKYDRPIRRKHTIWYAAVGPDAIRKARVKKRGKPKQ